jgi:hypothetical protein
MKLLPDDLYERLLMHARVSGFKETQAMLQQLQDAPSYVQGRTMNDAPALFRAIWDGGGWKSTDWNIYHGETLAWVFFQKAAAAMLRDGAPFLTEEEIKALSLISSRPVSKEE